MSDSLASKRCTLNADRASTIERERKKLFLASKVDSLSESNLQNLVILMKKVAFKVEPLA